LLLGVPGKYQNIAVGFNQRIKRCGFSQNKKAFSKAVCTFAYPKSAHFKSPFHFFLYRPQKLIYMSGADDINKAIAIGKVDGILTGAIKADSTF